MKNIFRLKAFVVVLLGLISSVAVTQTQTKPTNVAVIKTNENERYGDMTNIKIDEIKAFNNQFGHPQLKLVISFTTEITTDYLVAGFERYLSQSAENNPHDQNSEQAYRLLLKKIPPSSGPTVASGTFKKINLQSTFILDCSYDKVNSQRTLVFAVGMRPYDFQGWTKYSLQSYQNIEFSCQQGVKPVPTISDVYSVNSIKIRKWK